jgi:hypothetical protein
MTSSVSIKTDMAKNVFFVITVLIMATWQKRYKSIIFAPLLPSCSDQDRAIRKKKHFVAMSVLIEKELAITERIFHCSMQ